MEIIKVMPRGYCKGVIRAIRMAVECTKRYPNQPITILGMLVHNHYVMKALALHHIKMIDDPNKTREQLLDEITEGVVIFTAHGIAPQVLEKAQKKGLICIDASCPDVLKTQVLVKAKLDAGYEVIYIGKAKHPEAEAVCALSDHIHFMEPKDPIISLPEGKLFITNQTTMSIYDLESLFQKLKEYYPDAEFCEEICNATRIRQEAVAELEQIDVLYVVGDRFSNNSNRLAQIGAEHGIKSVYLIDTVNDIESNQLHDAKRVAVTAGASTPTYLTDQVIAYLQDFREDKQKPKLELSALLNGIIE